MTNGVPQGSVLGPQFFTVYIDDLELETKYSVSQFADDTKLSGRGKCAEDTESLQRDIDSLSEWAKIWSTMLINVRSSILVGITAKCTII